MTKSNYKVKVLFTDDSFREKFFATIQQAEEAYKHYKNATPVKEVKIYQVQNSTVDELVKSGKLWYKLAIHDTSKR
jgi:inorganic pyrophosphatase